VNADGTITSSLESKTVSFDGLPLPGASCGTSAGAFGCPFRTGGRGCVPRALPHSLILVCTACLICNDQTHSDDNMKPWSEFLMIAMTGCKSRVLQRKVRTRSISVNVYDHTHSDDNMKP
jgi:hypothetical protein